MAVERRRFQGELTAWLAAEIVRHIPFSGENLSPVAINPYREVRPTAAAADLDRWHKRQRWRAMVDNFRRVPRERTVRPTE